MKWKIFVWVFMLILVSTVSIAAISPVYKECVQRGYEVKDNFDNGTSYCVFPNNSTCSLEEFNSGVCGQEFMTTNYCVGEGVMVWDQDMCCAGLRPYLPPNTLGQSTCQPIEHQAPNYLLYLIILVILAIIISLVYLSMKKGDKTMIS